MTIKHSSCQLNSRVCLHSDTSSLSHHGQVTNSSQTLWASGSTLRSTIVWVLLTASPECQLRCSFVCCLHIFFLQTDSPFSFLIRFRINVSQDSFLDNVVYFHKQAGMSCYLIFFGVICYLVIIPQIYQFIGVEK